MKRVERFRFSYSTADAKNLVAILLGVEVLFIFLTHIVAPGPSLGPLRNFLDVDREVSIPTWFSSIQLFALAVVLSLQARRSNQLGGFFVLLALGFIFLSMDEAAAIHDSIYRSAQALSCPGSRAWSIWSGWWLTYASA